jgi:dihydropteroate synthase
VQLFGVVNASPDSLNVDSIVRTPEEASSRVELLLQQGCFGIDLGGQGSTFNSTEVDPDEEWRRLYSVIPPIVASGVPISVDTWRPAVARRALDAGVTWLNAADGMQIPEMIECPIVLPFLNGPDPHRLRHIDVGYDPVQVIIEFFEDRLRALAAYGVRDRVVLDPGTGFAPHDWEWADRFFYQREVYSRLDELRRFDLPLYIALPWRDTDQHRELMDIVVEREPEYGRVHYPMHVDEARQRVASR